MPALQIHNSQNPFELFPFDVMSTSILSYATDSPFDILQYQKKTDNIEKLKSFQKLPDNWNDHGAKSFDENLIERCINLIKSSALQNYQPDIFPTGRDSIQFEYEKSNGEYLEIEIYLNHFAYFYIDFLGHEKESEDADWEDILKLINEFHNNA